ncbi:MAG: hypothetical protein WKG07_03680 [Hymenobacter sp.]
MAGPRPGAEHRARGGVGRPRRGPGQAARAESSRALTQRVEIAGQEGRRAARRFRPARARE